MEPQLKDIEKDLMEKRDFIAELRRETNRGTPEYDFVAGVELAIDKSAYFIRYGDVKEVTSLRDAALAQYHKNRNQDCVGRVAGYEYALRKLRGG